MLAKLKLLGSKRKVRWIGAGLVLVLGLAFAALFGGTSKQPVVTLTFAGFTNEPMHFAGDGRRLDGWIVRAVLVAGNNGSHPLEISRGQLWGHSSVRLMQPANWLGPFSPPVVLRPGQSHRFLAFTHESPWEAEVQYQRRTLVDSQFVRLWKTGNPALQFLARIGREWNRFVSVRTDWITNQPPMEAYAAELHASVWAGGLMVARKSVGNAGSSRWGNIHGAEDATRRAVRSANEATTKRGFGSPFEFAGATSSFENGAWVWHGQAVSEAGKVEAMVRLETDGWGSETEVNLVRPRQ
jgi:hypothetical protein